MTSKSKVLVFVLISWKPPFCLFVVTNCYGHTQIVVILCRDASWVFSCCLMLAGRIVENGFLGHAVDSNLYGVGAQS